MLIRHASEADQKLIALVLQDAYAGIISRMPSPDAGKFVAAIPGAIERYASHGTWLIAEEEGVCMGTVAFFGPGSTKHPLFQGNVAHIQLLGVRAAFIRRGIGKALVKECVAMAKAVNAAEFLLQTSELMPEARRLYEKLAFAVRHELPPVWGVPGLLYARGVA